MSNSDLSLTKIRIVRKRIYQKILQVIKHVIKKHLKILFEKHIKIFYYKTYNFLIHKKTNFKKTSLK